jgi:hypothetical protein
MAKKQTKSGSESTEDPELTKEEKAKLRRPIGLFLRKDVRKEVELIADEEDLNRHALLSYAISYFIRQYRAGKVKIEKEQTTKLKLDI